MRTYLLPFALLATLTLSACSGGKDSVEICDNGVDDDGDGQRDCADADCDVACVEICDDGEDNDADGAIDCADDECFGVACVELCDDGADNDGDGAVDCDDSDCVGSCPEICDDNVDNDGDGKADCNDPDCGSICDADGDGYWSSELGFDDCDDTNPDIYRNAPENCDGLDNDCDGLVDDEDPDNNATERWYYDADGDGYGNNSQFVVRCEQPPDTINVSGDCNDSRAEVNPGMTEVCNTVDDDCNGQIDEDDPALDTSTLRVFYPDKDLDGYGDGAQASIEACAGIKGWAEDNTDCDDQESHANPGLAERLCDGIDNDCDPASVDDDQLDADQDGFTFCEGDCDDAEALAFPGNPEVQCTGIDEDCDLKTPDDPDADKDGYSVCYGDCDDDHAIINPGRPEVMCNGYDDDCDPLTLDDDLIDDDNDGYTFCLGDCDDTDPLVNPAMVEEVCNNVDDDCSKLTQDQPDEDGDGYVTCGGEDCDDTVAFIHPGQNEYPCNGVDEDCDPTTLDDTGVDYDGDGYSAACGGDCDDADPTLSPGLPEVQCNGQNDDCDPSTPDDADEDLDGWSVCQGDCDDTEARINPNQVEVYCNGYDEDCDPLTVDDDATDNDLDGFTECQGDCDDAEPTANPNGTEVQCTGVDEDCDPKTEDSPDGDLDGLGVCEDCDDTNPGLMLSEVWYQDLDGDGFGGSNPTVPRCVPPGYDYTPASLGVDCDDLLPSVNPGALEVCDDGVDQNCDGGDYTPCDQSATVLYEGQSTVDLVDDTWTGSEELVISGETSGQVFCRWAWQSTDWAHTPGATGQMPITRACQDPDGNPCLFSFSTHLSSGQQTQGHCELLIDVQAAAQPQDYGYGYTENYTSGGQSFGPAFMYYSNTYNSWTGLTTPVTWDEPTGAFEYTIDGGLTPAPY